MRSAPAMRPWRVLAAVVCMGLGCGAGATQAPAAQPSAARAQPAGSPAPLHATPAPGQAPQPPALQMAAAEGVTQTAAAPALELQAIAPVQLPAPPFARTLVAPTRALPSAP